MFAHEETVGASGTTDVAGAGGAHSCTTPTAQRLADEAWPPEVGRETTAVEGTVDGLGFEAPTGDDPLGPPPARSWVNGRLESRRIRTTSPMVVDVPLHGPRLRVHRGRKRGIGATDGSGGKVGAKDA